MPARSDFLHPIDAVQHAERTARSPSDKQTGHIVHANHLSNGAGRRRWPSGDSPARSTVCSESDCASSRIAVYLVLTGYIIPQVEMDIQGHFRTLFFGIRKCLRFFMHCCPSNSDSIHHTTGKYCQTIAKYANRKFFYFYFPACRSLSATRRALLWKR